MGWDGMKGMIPKMAESPGGGAGAAGGAGGRGAAEGGGRGAVALAQLLVLGAAAGVGATALVLGGAALGGLLAGQGLGLGLGQVLRRALPGRIQDQALVVLRLREDARPGVEQRRGRVDCVRDRLFPGSSSSAMGGSVLGLDWN